jgi:excisionase family DNA binding protein
MERHRGNGHQPRELPFLLTVADAAAILRTTRKAIYAMAARGALPGATRLGRRLLVRRDDLLDWLDRNRTPSSKEVLRR